VVAKKQPKLQEAERDAAAAGPAPAGDSGAAAEKGRFTINRSGNAHGVRDGPNQPMRVDGSEWPNPHGIRKRLAWPISQAQAVDLALEAMVTVARMAEYRHAGAGCWTDELRVVRNVTHPKRQTPPGRVPWSGIDL
jgi:hypothetical protein